MWHRRSKWKFAVEVEDGTVAFWSLLHASSDNWHVVDRLSDVHTSHLTKVSQGEWICNGPGTSVQKPPMSTTDYMLIWSRYYGLGPARIRWVGQWHKSDKRIHSLCKEQESHVSQRSWTRCLRSARQSSHILNSRVILIRFPRNTFKNSPSEIVNMQINTLRRVPLWTARSSLWNSPNLVRSAVFLFVRSFPPVLDDTVHIIWWI